MCVRLFDFMGTVEYRKLSSLQGENFYHVILRNVHGKVSIINCNVVLFFFFNIKQTKRLSVRNLPIK